MDAVIISVPDHWHSRIAIDAMEAGKDIYLEKPMVQDLEDGHKVINAQRSSNRVLQVGSPFKCDVVYDKAKELFESGAIGTLNMVQAQYSRHSSLGAWQYSIPPKVSAADLDWDRFLGDAPQRPFDPLMARDMSEVTAFDAPPGYDLRYDHFANFFEGVRNRTPTVEDAVVGFRAAAPALLANLSYFDNKIYDWDPMGMKLVS